MFQTTYLLWFTLLIFYFIFSQMDGEMRMDPSSISLFSSANAFSVDEHTRSSMADDEAQRPSSSTSQMFHHGMDEGGTEKDVKFSAYKRKKNTEVIKRRNLIDRLDKLKDQHGISVTIPQFKTVTNNQLSIFLRRLRKSSDIKQYVSMEVLQKIFTADDFDDKEELTKGPKMQKHLGIEHQRLFDGDLLTKHEDEELTDEEITDYEDDDIFGSVEDNLSHEMYELLEQEMQILAADAQAVEMQNEIRQRLKIAEMKLAELEEQEQLIFEQPMETGNEEEDSMTSARCRALLDRPQRPLVWHDFDESRREQCQIRPIGPNKRCDTEDYCFADGSLHPTLSLPSAIPLDAQILKYLHVIDIIPGEVELRRFKTAKLLSHQDIGDHKHAFYNLEEEFREEPVEDKHGPSESRAIKLSLPLIGKALKKRRQTNTTIGSRAKEQRNNTRNNKRDESESTDSDPNDLDYGEPSTSIGRPVKFKRRRMTYSSTADRTAGGISKSSKLEGRRTSHAADFGSSMFDYDSHVMDIGLPLPTIQKVENVEIAIPSFRKKSALADNFASSSALHCGRCDSGSSWEEIRRLHADLESQEKNFRFRATLGSTSRKSTITSTNNPMESSNK